MKTRVALLAVAASLCLAHRPPAAAWAQGKAEGQGRVERMEFGKTPDGTPVELYVLTNGRVTAKVMTYGALLTELDVPDRSGKQVAARRKAEEGNPNHVAAPMPGVISTIAVAAGQTIEAGDVLLTIEAMKMETVINADRAGKIAEVLVHAGSHVDAKDLLVVFA